MPKPLIINHWDRDQNKQCWQTPIMGGAWAAEGHKKEENQAGLGPFCLNFCTIFTGWECLSTLVGHQKVFSDPADWDLGSHKRCWAWFARFDGSKSLDKITIDFYEDESQQSQFLWISKQRHKTPGGRAATLMVLVWQSLPWRRPKADAFCFALNHTMLHSVLFEQTYLRFIMLDRSIHWFCHDVESACHYSRYITNVFT